MCIGGCRRWGRGGARGGWAGRGRARACAGVVGCPTVRRPRGGARCWGGRGAGGGLDEPRAVAFVRWTVGLTDDQAAAVVAALLGRAAGWTVGELIEHVQRHVLAIDPDWAEKRYKAAVRQRRVIGVRTEDGTA